MYLWVFFFGGGALWIVKNKKNGKILKIYTKQSLRSWLLNYLKNSLNENIKVYKLTFEIQR